MRRAIVIGVCFALTLSAIAAASAWCFGRDARRLGADWIGARLEVLTQIADFPSGSGPLVAWLGDSTIMGETVTPYPDLITGVRSWPVRGQGFDPYAYYFSLEPILAQRPALVVMVANLRVLGSSKPRDFSSLADRLPARALPGAALLPWYGRGISLPRLLLNRTLQWRPVYDTAMTLDGLRGLYQQADFWKRLDLTAEPLTVGYSRFFLSMNDLLHGYDTPLTPRTPAVRMLDACIERVRAAGSKVLVIVTPIPAEHLRTFPWYDPKANVARILALQQDWEAMGAQVVDLHDYLAQSFFRDYGGHPTLTGHQILAERLQSEVQRLVPPIAPGAPS